MTARPIGLVAALVLVAIAGAARAAASPESVDRLMQAMKVQQQLDLIYSQTLPAMQTAMRQSLGQKIESAEAERMFNGS